MYAIHWTPIILALLSACICSIFFSLRDSMFCLLFVLLCLPLTRNQFMPMLIQKHVKKSITVVYNPDHASLEYTVRWRSDWLSPVKRGDIESSTNFDFQFQMPISGYNVMIFFFKIFSVFNLWQGLDPMTVCPVSNTKFLAIDSICLYFYTFQVGIYGEVEVTWQILPRDPRSFVQVQGVASFGDLQQNASILLHVGLMI